VSFGSESHSVSASTAESEPPSLSRNITVVGVGKVSVRPDVATVAVGVEIKASTVSEAKAEVDARMATVVAALQELGIAEEDIQTSQFPTLIPTLGG